MLDWFIWSGIIFDAETILKLNWIVWIRKSCHLTGCKQSILKLNWIIRIKTVWLNWIAWNRNAFWLFKCFVVLFELELFICLKMDLALNNLQRLICHKTQTNNHTNKQTNPFRKDFLNKMGTRKEYLNDLEFRLLIPCLIASLKLNRLKYSPRTEEIIMSRTVC